MKNTTSRLSSILIELVFVLTVTFGTAVTSYAANQMINSKVTGVKASAVSTTSVKISWNKKKAATGYKIYRAASKTGKYRLVKTVKKGSIKSWKNTSLKSGKTYWYKVKAYQKYKKSGKVKYRYTKYSGKVSAKTRVAMTSTAVKGIKSSATGTTSIKVSWDKKARATGYKIYRATSKTGKYKLVKTINKSGTTYWKNTGLKSGKIYWYKVKAYQKSGSKFKYTKFSTKVSAKTKSNTEYEKNEIAPVSKDIVTVNGVAFDMTYYPKETVIGWDDTFDKVDSGFLSVVPKSKINPADITYVIDHGNSTVICDSNTPNILESHKDSVHYLPIFKDYYV